LTLPDKSTVSAFSYYFTKAISDDWLRADQNQDGILDHAEIAAYVQSRLDCACIGGLIPQRMTSEDLSNSANRFLGYDQSKVRDWETPSKSDLRNSLLLKSILTTLTTGDNVDTPIQEMGTQQVEMVEVRKSFVPSPKARALAALITKKTDPLLWGLKQIAEGKFDSAIATLLSISKGTAKNMDSVYMGLGLAEAYKGRYSSAVSYYLKGLEINKDSPELLGATAYTLFLAEDMEQSEKYYEKTLIAQGKLLGLRHPDLVVTYGRYVQVLLKDNKFKEAEKAERMGNKAYLEPKPKP
jgi:tetratricopeptide (TPR) repeat protein